MTREEFETGLIARLEDIKAYYKTYNLKAFEEGNKLYLTMTINGNSISANNGYFNVDENNPDRELPVNCWKFDDSAVVHNPIMHDWREDDEEEY